MHTHTHIFARKQQLPTGFCCLLLTLQQGLFSGVELIKNRTKTDIYVFWYYLRIIPGRDYPGWLMGQSHISESTARSLAQSPSARSTPSAHISLLPRRRVAWVSASFLASVFAGSLCPYVCHDGSQRSLFLESSCILLYLLVQLQHKWMLWLSIYLKHMVNNSLD